MNHSEIFNNIYKKSLWGYKSGNGSEPENSIPWIKVVNNFLNQSDINSILDFGCGDWRLGQKYKIGNKKYLGVDVSSVIIEEIQKYSKINISFVQGDATTMDIKYYDLILIKDVLQHLSNSSVNTILNKIMFSCKYALICNDFTEINKDITPGSYRGINLKNEPFKYNFEEIESWTLFEKKYKLKKMIYLYKNNKQINGVKK